MNVNITHLEAQKCIENKLRGWPTCQVIYQTQETIFHRDHPNTEKRVENTTRSGVFLTKFRVFG